ncbi:MAG: hypothetical protein ACRESZ_13265 [Methylococcales bacterium]
MEVNTGTFQATARVAPRVRGARLPRSPPVALETAERALVFFDSAVVRNSPPVILLREGWREGRKVCKKTKAFLAHCPAHKIDALR